MQNLIESLHDQLENLAEKGSKEGLTAEEFIRFLTLEIAIEEVEEC